MGLHDWAWKGEGISIHPLFGHLLFVRGPARACPRLFTRVGLKMVTWNHAASFTGYGHLVGDIATRHGLVVTGVR